MNPDAYEKGEQDAQSDVEANKCRLFWGTRGAWGRFFTDLMRKKYSVEVIHTDCLTCDEIQSYRQGYNDVVQAYIDSEFGKGAFEDTLNELKEFRLNYYQQRLKPDI